MDFPGTGWMTDCIGGLCETAQGAGLRKMERKERQAYLKDEASGADAPMGNTRSHPEHDG